MTKSQGILISCVLLVLSACIGIPFKFYVPAFIVGGICVVGIFGCLLLLYIDLGVK